MAVNRLTGFSGFDTEKMISDLMKVENQKVDKIRQSKQYKVWEQEAYREAIKSLQTFQGSFFDILKPETNIRSASMFAKFTSEVKIGSTASTAVSVTGTADVTSFEHAINSITQLATKDTWTGSAGLGVVGVESQALDFGAGKPPVFQINLSIDGTTKTVTVGMAAVGDIDTFITEVNNAIELSFGPNYSNVVTKEGADAIRFNHPGSTVKVLTSDVYTDVMTWMDITSGASSSDYTSGTVADVLGLTSTDLNDMTVNGKSLTSMGISTTTTFKDMITKINNGNADVKISFSGLNDRFKIESTEEGAVNAMTLSAEFKTKLGLDTNSVVAQDAIFQLDGTTLTKAANNFTIEGVTYTLKEEYDGVAGDIDITLAVDSTSIKDKIKSFVENYNNIVKSLNDKLNEKVYRDFLPLTDEEKEAMSEDDIKLWEAKAKSGVMKNSSEIQTMLTKMRQAIYEEVEGAGISMADIGISTSSNYKDNGKLVLDETKLTTALETKYDSVVKLFTSESDYEYLESGTATDRYKENGVGNRLYDILRDNIRTTRDSNNKKGALLEKAGTEGDASFYNNTLSTSILQYESRIDILLDAVGVKEDYYYNVFARMESALNQMNNQASWLSSQLGGS